MAGEGVPGGPPRAPGAGWGLGSKMNGVLEPGSSGSGPWLCQPGREIESPTPEVLSPWGRQVLQSKRGQ